MFAVPASAQLTQPHAGALAIAGEAGFFVPDKEFGIAPTISGSAEFYLLGRVSVRGLVGWTSPDFELRSVDSLRQVWILGDVLYNWEGGAWHPFLVGGVGVHFLKTKVAGQPAGRLQDDWRKKGGLNGGAGIEHFSRHDITVKVEVLYQYVAHDAFEPNPSGLALKIGLKKYLW
ncbi:MAG: hypothetical protein HYZ58_07540 [Acidobacteria bacterium]|nr:hypothetical protein [Acidobacteriota bacterium]MBI3262989.1 hypothetical protein [Acidobacteriota bacterium]